MARVRAPHTRRAATGGTSRAQPWTPWLAVTIAAVVVLLAVFALGRASAGGGSPNARSPSSAIPNVGPTRTLHGVPVGYAHSRAGALAAALNYVAVIVRPNVTFDARRLHSMFSAMSTAALTQRLMAQYAPIARRVATTPLVRSIRSGSPLVAMAVPVAYRFARATRDRVTVQLWTVTVLGADAVPPRANWQRISLPLAWIDGDWKYIAGVRRQPGPTPRLTDAQTPTDATAFVSAVQGLHSFRYAP
jgi:hypothetical protein